MANILICTGIYPPQIGGPAQYAKSVAEEFRAQGHQVKVLTYNLERKLPSLVRHELFFWRTLFSLGGVDFVLVLDTFSVGWPAIAAAKLLGKKTIIRTGGDFLWEAYVERTDDLVLLREFYETRHGDFNWKEKIIFQITKWTLEDASAIIFSTDWHRKIFEKAYDLDPKKNFVVENYYGEKLPQVEKENRAFVAGTRPLKWKNINWLREAFVKAKEEDPTIELDTTTAPYEKFIEKIRHSYAVILVSLGDISPNMILDAIRANTPFILTKETGLYDRLKDVGLFVDPKDPEDVKEKILYLADRSHYRFEQEKVERFTFTHSWKQICEEILDVAKGL
jgi:glycosyltransferase involved in cell wall biosynthesis